MLTTNGENGHPCLVPDLKEKDFNFCPLSVMFAVGVSYMAFIVLNLEIVLGSMEILMMLILLIHEHGTCFQLLVSSLISFFSVV